MTQQVGDWGKYGDLLQRLGNIQQTLDWSSWSNLTASIRIADPGLWGAVQENNLYARGLAELLGEIYQVKPIYVDLDDASQLKTGEQQLLDKLWHIVSAQPATDMVGYESWDGYLVCWEPDGSLTYATTRDSEDWTPVPRYDETDGADAEAEDSGDHQDYDDAYQPEESYADAPPVFTPWGDYWIKDEAGQRWYGASQPDGPWYSTPQEFEATLSLPAEPGPEAEAAAAAQQVDAMLEALFTDDFFQELFRRVEDALSPSAASAAIARLSPEDFSSIIQAAFASGT
jgi:hypothetical protein